MDALLVDRQHIALGDAVACMQDQGFRKVAAADFTFGPVSMYRAQKAGHNCPMHPEHYVTSFYTAIKDPRVMQRPTATVWEPSPDMPASKGCVCTSDSCFLALNASTRPTASAQATRLPSSAAKPVTHFRRRATHW